MVKFRFIILILLLSLRTFSEAQTVSLQLCSPPIKGNACQMSCTTTDQTNDIVFAWNGNERGKCSIVLGSPSCGANTAQPSATVTTFDITSLNRASDDGLWTCTYGSGPGDTATQTLTVLTYPSTPSSTDITHSNGMTTDLQASSSQIVNLAVVMDCTSPEPTVTWNFKQCGTSTVVASKAGNVAEDTTASTVCGSSEKNYQSTTSVSFSDGVAGKCVDTQVDILVNGFTAHTVIAGFTITFPGVETTSESGLGPEAIAGIVIGSIFGVAAIVAAVVTGVLKKYPCQKGSNNKKPDSGNSGDKKIERPSKVNEKNTKPLSPSTLTLTNEAKPGGRALPPIPQNEKKKKTPRKKKKRVKTEDGEDTEKLPPIQKKERNIEHYTRDTQNPES